MKFEDVQGMTLTRAIHWIEAAIVAAVSAALCVNLLARFVGSTEWDVRRIQERAIRRGFLHRDESGRLREGSAYDGAVMSEA